MEDKKNDQVKVKKEGENQEASTEKPGKAIQIDLNEKKKEDKGLLKSKKLLLWGILGLFSVVAILVMVYYFLFARSFFTVKVVEEKTGKVLPEVEVQIGETKLKTDNFGKARFDSLKAGQHMVKVILEGYSEVEEPVTLKRGNNGEFTISLNLILINISGVVRDYVNKGLIEGMKVTLKEQTVETDSEGKFQFTEVVPGTQKIKLEKDGYLSREVEIAGLTDTELGDFYLVPSTAVVFVSNRDGNKAVYKGYFDGQGITKLWENKKGFDDYQAVLSPNKESTAFFSNRDGEKDQYGEYKGQLYLNSVTGLSLKKISGDSGEVAWFDDSGGLVYSYTLYDNDNSTSSIKSYELATQKLKELFKDSDFERKEVTSSAYLSNVKIASKDRLIFNVSNWADSTKAGLYKADRDGTDLKKLTDKNPYSYTLTSDRSKVQFMYYQNANPERYEINIDTGEEKQIPLEPRKGQSIGQGYFDYEEKESPVGEFKAYIDYRDGKNDLYISDLQGNGERRLSTLGGVSDFEFTANGKYIVFYVIKDQEQALYVVGLQEGNEPIKITDVVEFVGMI